jgi:hypothetical protein
MSSAYDPFDADYFLRGRETGKSLYKDYRWMPNLTIPMVADIANYLGISHFDSILDFGCARGYMVKAFRRLGYNAYGYDVSKWAIDNADLSVMDYLSRTPADVFGEESAYDWLIAKDVLEHVPHVDHVINDLINISRLGLFVVVPLSLVKDGPYVIPDYEKDITHIHRLPLHAWASMFIRPGWSVDARYRVKGVKDNYYRRDWEAGNGFITVRRVS